MENIIKAVNKLTRQKKTLDRLVHCASGWPVEGGHPEGVLGELPQVGQVVHGLRHVSLLLHRRKLALKQPWIKLKAIKGIIPKSDVLP